jgi:hypothetical protein
MNELEINAHFTLFVCMFTSLEIIYEKSVLSYQGKQERTLSSIFFGKQLLQSSLRCTSDTLDQVYIQRSAAGAREPESILHG